MFTLDAYKDELPKEFKRLTFYLIPLDTTSQMQKARSSLITATLARDSRLSMHVGGKQAENNLPRAP